MPTPRALPRSFFARPADVVAPALLGCVLRRTLEDGSVRAGIIVETEAYLGPEDRASHAFGGRRTARNESMYARPGTCYVYFTYGMHFMCNVSCLREGHPAAVLIRALEPVEGLDAIRTDRPGIVRDRDLCSGPGRLCQALRIMRELDGSDLTSDRRLSILAPRGGVRGNDDVEEQRCLGRSARIGVEAAGAWAEAALRWFVSDHPHVSRARPSVARASVGGRAQPRRS